MDRRGKQRLIGAVILVGLAVVVVPELLSGSKLQGPAAADSAQLSGAPEPVRNVTMDLAGADGRPADGRPADGRASEPALLAANAAQTPASTAASATAPPMSAPASAAPAPTAAVAPAPLTPTATHAAHTSGPPQAPLESAAAPPTSDSSFAVQLGSFANRGNADNLLQQLKAQGYRVYELAEGAGGTARYRVRVGPLSDRDSAEKIMAKLKASGHDSTLVAPR